MGRLRDTFRTLDWEEIREQLSGLFLDNVQWIFITIGIYDNLFKENKEKQQDLLTRKLLQLNE